MPRRCVAMNCSHEGSLKFEWPKDKARARLWTNFVRTKRKNFEATPSSQLCSRHFTEDSFKNLMQYRHGYAKLLRLKSDAVPTIQMPKPVKENGALDLTLHKIEELQSKNLSLRSQMENMVINNRFGLERFSASDDDIRLYTRFASYDHLKSFWNQIEPATHDIVTRAQPVHPAAPTSLQLIDEFFLFMLYLSLGMMEKELAHRFGIPQSSVSRIIITWANILYTVLGAIGIWLSEETVRENLPEAFYKYPDTQVILNCTRLRCQTLESPLLQVFSGCKSHSTFKGLVGVAPHGAVTFVSPLFEGSIGDHEILKRSGLIPLLKPTMALMVDQSFLAELEVPCKVHAPASLKKAPSTAALQVHVDRVLCRVKERKLFQTEIPMSLSGCMNQLFTVACVLVNYQNGPLYKT